MSQLRSFESAQYNQGKEQLERSLPVSGELKSSRFPGLYRHTPFERVNRIGERVATQLSLVDIYQGTEGLSLDTADQMVENVIGIQGLPVGVAVNCRFNGQDFVVPMMVEEPSVVAAVSNMAKKAREDGGVRTWSDEPIMIAQIQLLDVPDFVAAEAAILGATEDLLSQCSERLSRLVKRGGGPRGLEVRRVQVPELDGGGEFLVIHVFIDCRDAMGANLVNDIAEFLAPQLAALSQGRPGLRILSNYSDRRKASAQVRIHAKRFSGDLDEGLQIIAGIVGAYQFAAADPYRAVTHNKGVMNGVDAVALATGNDWRAIEAGAHAYAARSGVYSPMTRWWIEDEVFLCGSITLPMAVGTVGGTIKVHPTVQANLSLLGVKNASQLAEIMVAVGLLQNLAALTALSTEGIQRGHMSLHARHIAAKVGVPTRHIEDVTAVMVARRSYGEVAARQVWMELRVEKGWESYLDTL